MQAAAVTPVTPDSPGSPLSSLKTPTDHHKVLDWGAEMDALSPAGSKNTSSSHSPHDSPSKQQLGAQDLSVSDTSLNDSDAKRKLFQDSTDDSPEKASAPTEKPAEENDSSDRQSTETETQEKDAGNSEQTETSEHVEKTKSEEKSEVGEFLSLVFFFFLFFGAIGFQNDRVLEKESLTQLLVIVDADAAVEAEEEEEFQDATGDEEEEEGDEFVDAGSNLATPQAGSREVSAEPSPQASPRHTAQPRQSAEHDVIETEETSNDEPEKSPVIEVTEPRSEDLTKSETDMVQRENNVMQEMEPDRVTPNDPDTITDSVRQEENKDENEDVSAEAKADDSKNVECQDDTVLASQALHEAEPDPGSTVEPVVESSPPAVDNQSARESHSTGETADAAPAQSSEQSSSEDSVTPQDAVEPIKNEHQETSPSSECHIMIFAACSLSLLFFDSFHFLFTGFIDFAGKNSSQQGRLTASKPHARANSQCQYLPPGAALSTMGAAILDHVWGQPCCPIAQARGLRIEHWCPRGVILSAP